MIRDGWARRSATVAIGIAVLAASSHLTVPMAPVPMTLQTLAVLLLGALAGWRLALAAILAWLALAAAGLPLLAGGTGGLDRFTGPTAGYLVAFPFAALLAGLLAERGWADRPAGALALMLAGHAACLLPGAAWLAVLAGAERAVSAGLLPFLPGALVKSAIGAFILVRWRRRNRTGTPAIGRS